MRKVGNLVLVHTLDSRYVICVLFACRQWKHSMEKITFKVLHPVKDFYNSEIIVQGHTCSMKLLAIMYDTS